MSQYGEHTHILEYFAGKTGRFLDVGAFDGVTFSNTRPLADLGWSGVCVEPSPPAFCWLMKNYAGNERVKLINAAMAGTFGAGARQLRPFFVNTPDAYAAEMMSTFSAEHVEKFQDFPFREIWISGIDWATLSFSPVCHPDGFDFVNIDVEGINWEVLYHLPFGIIKPKMVCIEMDPADMVSRMAQDLADHGLTQQTIIGGNLLAARPK